MVLYGYDASVYNAVQGSDNWKEWFNDPNDNMLGLINTVYTVGAIISGFFLGGPVADYLGRRAGMGIGAILVIISTLLQTFAPKGNIGMFMAGRVIIGVGQGLALSKLPFSVGGISSNDRHSRRIHLHRRASPSRDPWQDHVSVADFLQRGFIHLL
jgi:MFS family permease